jgi:glycosyltransferase involved in cell wall biosynthesis
MKVAVIIDNLGPYHLARLRPAGLMTDLLVVEVAGQSAEYAWETSEDQGAESKELHSWKMSTLIERGTSRQVSTRELQRRLNRVLDDYQPQVVVIPGWSSKAAFVALRWCLRRGVPTVAMSDSTAWDEKRVIWKEWVKQRIVAFCSAALVAGTPHKDYMVKLGMPPERVFLGYDAVDNDYFALGAKEVRNQNTSSGLRPPSPQSGERILPERYFLASARFVEKKNLPRLIEAYARFRAKCEVRSPQNEVWNLVLLGDGKLRNTLNTQISTLDLHAHVQMPGFKQYPDLPAYYGLAKTFIHASTTEQWGLVVNEAMASGLPVLVSNRCGCAQDLVEDDVNGYRFDPYNVGQLADLMLKVSSCSFPLSSFGAASVRIIENWGPQRFASGLKAAINRALEIGPKSAGIRDTVLLRALSLR